MLVPKRRRRETVPSKISERKNSAPRERAIVDHGNECLPSVFNGDEIMKAV
jgi:hypothetical protein